MENDLTLCYAACVKYKHSHFSFKHLANMNRASSRQIQEMKRDAVLVALTASYNNSGIVSFLKIVKCRV